MSKNRDQVENNREHPVVANAAVDTTLFNNHLSAADDTIQKVFNTMDSGSFGSLGTGLERVTEGVNSGWRLVGSNPADFGTIGVDAVSMSHKDTSTTTGATGSGSFSIGVDTEAIGDYSSAEGRETVATGVASHAEGRRTHSTGIASHSEGYLTVSPGESSHAEGDSTQSVGDFSHSEGDGVTAVGKYSHSEGTGTVATGESSHAEGHNTESTGNASHAEGTATVATGGAAHAEGNATIALNNFSHVTGSFNVGTSVDTIHETGNGIDDANRSNSFEIYTDGRIRAPSLTPALVDDPKSLVTKEYVELNSIKSDIAVGGTGSQAILNMVQITQVAYDALATPNVGTAYFIIG